MQTTIPESIKSDFAIFQETSPSGRDLRYLDSAATALRPQRVIQAVVNAMSNSSGGVHRSVHYLGDRATATYEDARITASRWVQGVENELVFTRNTTDSLSLVARGWPDPGRILVSATDHHSALLVWDPDRTTRVQPNEDGSVDEEAMLKELRERNVSVVCISHVSNVTGRSPNVARLAEEAHRHGAILVLDAAQSAPHGSLDTEQLGCDFLAFSGHKLGSPSGIGVLWGKADQLRRLTEVVRGGGVVEHLRGDRVHYKDFPWRLEAGTPSVECAAGLNAAIDYLWQFSPAQIHEHVRRLRNYAIEKLSRIPKVRWISTRDPETSGPLSFLIEGCSSHVIARGLSDAYGICLRSGFHCAEPLHQFLGIGPTLRLSFYVYNQPSDIDFVAEAIQELIAVSPR